MRAMSPYKSKARQREYQKNWTANRRSDEAVVSKVELTHDDVTLSPGDLKRAMLACINELLAAEMEADKRSRAMSQLVQVCIKLFETGELADRVRELEEAVKERQPQGWQSAAF
jgi:hypothetical protein